MDWLEPATEGSLQISGRTQKPLSHRRPKWKEEEEGEEDEKKTEKETSMNLQTDTTLSKDEIESTVSTKCSGLFLATMWA
ncbi:hypothetical protein PoB_001618500 [Plakobranchus ocellatus]|uniref:Uncharacterized protein n=1 Tax=Plakobranchus ocellatus TaxID=259542 RepID=A0AAV3Z524_9GAST|nr:hypothetical protein PoB_001618500 [Plakobranchus ocellatus]